MKKEFLVLILVIVAYLNVKAQKWELGGFIGATSYQGELAHGIPFFTNPNWPGNIGQFKFVFNARGVSLILNPYWGKGIIVRHKFSDRLTLSGRIYLGGISGDDRNAENINDRMRNLDFVSPIYEFSISPEFYIKKNNFAENRFNMYLFGGLGLFYFNPQALYFDNFIQLQPLGTEGQGIEGYNKRYSKINLSLLFGSGLKFVINQKWIIGLETGFRYSNTDYLDDISGDYVSRQLLIDNSGEIAANLGYRTPEYTGVYDEPIGSRGNPDNKDWYVFTGFTVSRSLGQKD